MEYKELKLPGFTIALKPAGPTETDHGAITVLPAEMAEMITDFLKEQLKKSAELNVRMSISHWDDEFVLEETIYQIKNEKEHNKHSSRNYWIGTDE